LATTPEISCRVTRTLLLYVREKNNGSLGKLLDGLELDEAYLSDPNNWISHAFLHILYRRMIAMLEDDNAVYHMALGSDRLQSLGLLNRIVRLLGNPRLIYSQGPILNRLLKRNGEVIIHDIGEAWVLLEDRYHSGDQKTRCDCDYTRGILEGIPTLFGMPPARIQEIECQVPVECYGKRFWEDAPVPGSKGCLFRVEWNAGKVPRFWDRILNLGIYRQTVDDLLAADRKIQEKYDESRALAENLQRINQELREVRREQEANIARLEASEAKYRLLAETLRRSEEKYRQLSETSHDLIVTVDFDFKILYVNQAVLNLTGGLSPVGGSLVDYTPDHLREMQQVLMQKRRDGFSEVLSFEWEIDHLAGKKSVIDIRSTLLKENERPSAVMFVARDITERKQAEEALRESENKFRDMAELLPAVVFELDSQGRLTYVNRYALNLYKYTPEDFKSGINALDMIAAPDRERAAVNIMKMMEQERQTGVEYMAVNANGEEFPVIVYATPIYKEGKTIGLRGIVVDITERKRMEERLQRFEKMEMLGSLAGGVAHDLNNVLGVLVGYSELLAEKLPATSALRRYADNILQAGLRGAAIVQDLLTLSRRGVTVMETVDMNKVLQDCFRTPEYENMKSRYPLLVISNDLDQGLLSIKGSPVHLGKTVINLILNAAESISGPGEVTVRTRNTYLDRPIRGYDTISEGEYALLTVEDTGKGIPPEDVKKIFEPFYTKKVMGRSGTGLGLAVVWGTVKDHGGYIEVESEQGRGTTFTLYFPVSGGEAARLERPVSQISYIGRGEQLLIVDDVKEQRELAARMLERLGYRVEAVASGEEALSYLKDSTVDLVVLDMIMDPGMDGLDTYRGMMEIRPGQRAIIASGFSETERVRQAQALGAGAFVRKPYIMEKIGLAVRTELDR